MRMPNELDVLIKDLDKKPENQFLRGIIRDYYLDLPGELNRIIANGFTWIIENKKWPQLYIYDGKTGYRFNGFWFWIRYWERTSAKPTASSSFYWLKADLWDKLLRCDYCNAQAHRKYYKTRHDAEIDLCLALNRTIRNDILDLE